MPAVVIQASSARAATLYAVIVSSWNGRFSWLVRDRSHWQNSLICIARSCSPVIPAAGGASRGRGGTPAAPGKEATRSGDLRGEPEAERALVMADPSLGELRTLCGPQAMYTRPGC
jgi:hypothetical protein